MLNRGSFQLRWQRVRYGDLSRERRRVIRPWRWQRFASLKVIGQSAQLRDDSRLKLTCEAG
jgi:hypothetical protein